MGKLAIILRVIIRVRVKKFGILFFTSTDEVREVMPSVAFVYVMVYWFVCWFVCPDDELKNIIAISMKLPGGHVEVLE